MLQSSYTKVNQLIIIVTVYKVLLEKVQTVIVRIVPFLDRRQKNGNLRQNESLKSIINN